jgi:hypothetical protein
LNTSALAQDYWAKYPETGGVKKRKLILTASMGGVSGMPAVVSGSTSFEADDGEPGSVAFNERNEG